MNFPDEPPFCIVILQSTFHRYRMLALPDELGDFRRVVNELRAENLRYGVTRYSYSHVLTALAGESQIFTALDRHPYPPYQRLVEQQDVISLVWPTYQPALPAHIQRLLYGQEKLIPQKTPAPGGSIELWGRTYERIGDLRQCGEVSWCRLQLVKR